MPTKPSQSRLSPERAYLDFYGRLNISPVAQDISDLARHFERRTALYHHLGLPPRFIAGRTVLEFGPGTGHNALVTNSFSPERYVLVDANPMSLAELRQQLTRCFDDAGNCEIVDCQIEQFDSAERFDLVLCEGVIPTQRNPKAFLRHVAQFTAPGGVLVITCISPVSWVSEALRRLAAALLTDARDSIPAKLDRLRTFFAPHLQTLKGMTRSVDDWILDNMLQPFVGELLSVEDAIRALRGNFDAYASSPRFLVDWRWYKDICGEETGHNDVALEQAGMNLHNLMDYRFAFAPREASQNQRLHELCSAIADVALVPENVRSGATVQQLQETVAQLAQETTVFSPATGEALDEFAEALHCYLETNEFPDLRAFTPFFGRGRQYLSFIRKAQPRPESRSQEGASGGDDR